MASILYKIYIHKTVCNTQYKCNKLTVNLTSIRIGFQLLKKIHTILYFSEFPALCVAGYLYGRNSNTQFNLQLD